MESDVRTDPRRTGGAATPKSLGRRVLAEIRRDDVPGEAAKVAYNAFLALPPAILVLFALTGFFGGARTADWITARLQAALPPEASRLIDDFVRQIVHENAPGPLSIGLLLALWAASNVFMALGDALNAAYDVTDSRSFMQRRLVAVAVMLGGVVLMLAGSLIIVAGPQIARALGLGIVWSVVQWPLAFLFVAAAFWMVYYVLPDRDQSGCKVQLAKAALTAAVGWVAATALFRLYVINFGSYSESYGILGAMIVLLLWLWVTGLVALAGGELASELENRDVEP